MAPESAAPMHALRNGSGCEEEGGEGEWLQGPQHEGLARGREFSGV